MFNEKNHMFNNRKNYSAGVFPCFYNVRCHNSDSGVEKGIDPEVNVIQCVHMHAYYMYSNWCFVSNSFYVPLTIYVFVVTVQNL